MLNPERQPVNVRVGEQKHIADTNKSDRGPRKRLDPPGFGRARKPLPASSAWCEIGSLHLPLSCRLFSSGTNLLVNVKQIRLEFFTFFVNSDTWTAQIYL